MDWFADHAWETWLIVAAALAACELLSMSMVFAMLAGGAVVGAIAAAVGAGGVLSAILALATAVALLALLRPNIIKALHSGPELRTGVQALVGKRATVIREVAPDQPGRVKIGGEEWQAAPYDERDRIEAGEVVDVVQIKGATAFVLRAQQLE